MDVSIAEKMLKKTSLQIFVSLTYENNNILVNFQGKKKLEFENLIPLNGSAQFSNESKR